MVFFSLRCFFQASFAPQIEGKKEDFNQDEKENKAMHEKRFWQHVDDRIGGWIKEPIVVTEENLMERNEKAVKADSHQKPENQRQNHSPLKGTNQAPLLLFLP